MSDTIVFDIETQNFFTDPGVGWDNFAALKISAVGMYSYAENKYSCFTENEIGAVAKVFAGAARIVGFSSNRYDVPVLQEYFNRLPEAERVDLRAKQSVDLLEEVEAVLGRRLSLDLLAQANLGKGKTGHGSKAIELYRDGKIEELKKYCLMDVELTKELYDLYVGRGYFLVPDRFTDKLEKLEFPKSDAQASFL